LSRSKEQCALHAAVANADVSVVRMLLKAGAQAHQKGKKYVSMCFHVLKPRARVSYLSPLFLGRYFDRLYTPHPSEACQKFFKFSSIMEQIRMRAMGESAP
jgi:hypothetical protein